jgi:hypothetical protein
MPSSFGRQIAHSCNKASRATIGVASLGDPNRLIEVIITAAR